jgi:hypothetical protein
LRFFAGVKGTEIRMASAARHAAAAAVGNVKEHEEERSVERLVDMEVSRKKI